MLKMCYRLLRNKDKGFTLIELMVVVVILGVLAAIAVPQLSGKADDARQNRAKADLKILGSAVQLYYFDEEDYPSVLTDLEPEYVKKVKPDPWSNAYVYDADEYEDGTIYGLYSKGQDGAAGGGDDISLEE